MEVSQYHDSLSQAEKKRPKLSLSEESVVPRQYSMPRFLK